MVAVVSGSGLGIFGSSVSSLGGIGGSGNAAPGRGNDRVYVNTATGNVIVQAQDERLSALGLDLNLVRTYNSQGRLDDDNGDNWRLGVHQRLYNLTSFVNQAGSTITKVFGDGREVTYEYDSTRGAYVSSEGGDAHDTLTFSNGEWTWKEGTTLVAETYDSDLRLIRSQDADHNLVSYQYFGSQLRYIDDASGQRIEFEYTGRNLTAIHVSSNGVTQTLTTYTYDGDDRLLAVRVDLSPTIANDALSYVTTYAYDGASHRIASISQSDGTSVQFAYRFVDGQYRVHTYTDAAGRVTTFNYTQPTGSSGSSGVQTSATANASALSTTRSTSHNLNTSALTQAAGSWQAATLLDTVDVHAATPQVVFDRFGNGFAVWSQGNNIVARRYTASTATWSAEVTLDSNTNTAYVPTLGIDRDTGDAVVAWVQSDGAANSLYVRSYNAAANTWGTVQLLESANGVVPAGGDALSASMANGNAVVTWIQNDGSANSVYMARMVNGSWTSPALLESTNDTATWPRVAIDANGNAMALWRQFSPSDGEYRIHSRYWNAASQALSAIQLLDGDGDRQPRVAFDADGNAFAVWGGGTQVRRFDKAAGQWSPQISLQNGTGDGSTAELSVDAAGNALVAWLESDGTAISVYARRFDAASGTWSAAALLETLNTNASTDHFLSVSLVGGEGIVAWLHNGASVTEAYAARLSNGVWGAATLLETRSDPTGDISAAVDMYGNATVVWVQADSHARSIYRAQYVGPYYVVPTGATWQSVANTLYGVNSPEAGSALQAAMGGGALSAGIRLSGLPTTLSVASTVPAYYTVRAGDTWAHIASAVYGTADVNAISALRTALGNPALVTGLELVVPANVFYTTSASYTAPLNYSATSTSLSQSYNLNSGAVTIPPVAWSAAALLEADNAEANSPQLSFDAAGNGIAVWAQGNDIIMRRFVASTGTWSVPVTLDANTNEAHAPTLSIDRQTGNAVVAWVQSDGVQESLYTRSYNASTNTWSTVQLLENSAGAVDRWPQGASISLMGEHAAVVWMQDDGVTNSVYLSRLQNGAWTAPALLDATDEDALHPQVSVDASGNTTVLWRQYSSADGEYRIHSLRWNAATQSFGSIQYLDAEGDRYPRLAFDNAGNGFAAWGQGAHVRHYDAATGVWSPQITLSNTENAYGVEIASDGAGNAIIAWIESDGTALSVYARRYDAASGTWGAAALLENSNDPVTLEFRLALSIVGGEAVVAWVQENGTAGDVYAAKLSGGAWSTPALLDSGEYWAGDLTAAVSATGDATVLWMQADGWAASIYEARLSSTPYYTVPSGATWQSIANALYGVDSVAAGNALQAALGSPALTTGLQLQFLPATLAVPTTVPPYYLVQTGDTWASIATQLYGTSSPDAVAALQAAMGNPTLVAGLRLEAPTGLNYSGSAGAAASYLQTEVTASGVVTRYEQDTSGRLIAVTVAPDTLALRTEYEYDADGNVTAIIRDPDGLNRITRMTHDSNGNLLSQRDDLGNTLERTYDAYNQLLTETIYQVRDPDGDGSGTASVPLTTHHAYDDEHHLRFTVSADGRVTEHRYLDDGQRQTTFTYTAALYSGGQFDTASLASWAAAQDQTQLQRVEYAYDFRGNLSSLTTFDNPGSTGAVTLFIYDQRGQLLQKIEPRGTRQPPNAGDNPLLYTTTYTYDGLGRVLSVSRWNKSADAPTVIDVSTTLTAYDDAHRATTVTLANGLVTTTLHGFTGEVISVVNGTAAAPTGLGTTIYTYDADGRLRIQTDPTGVRQYFEYDAAGRRVAQVDGDGTLTEYVYDDLGRVIKTIMYGARVNSATLTSLVDGNGRRTSVDLTSIRAAADDTPSEDRITRSVYDAAGLLIYEIDAAGALTQYFYDGAGRVTDEVRYAREVTIPRTVDQVLDGSFTIVPLPEDRRTRYFYDSDGLRRGTLDAMGYLVEFIYDAAGQLIHQIGYANQTAANLWSTGTFDQLRASAGIDEETSVDPERDVHSYFFYDGQGRQIGVLDAEGYLTQTRYNANGDISQTIRYNRVLTYTAGTSTFATLTAAAQGATSRTMSYDYDGSGRVTSETNYEGTVTKYVYNDVGQLISTTRALGTSEARTTATRYDFLGRVTRELSAEGAARITSSMSQSDIEDIWERYGVTYEYDQAGRRISATSRPNDEQTNVTRYFYDNDGRLRFEINQLGERKEYRYDALNQLSDEIYYTNRISTAGLSGGLLTDDALIATLSGNVDLAKDKHVTYKYTRTGKVASITTTKTTDAAENGSTTFIYNAFGEVHFKIESIDSESIPAPRKLQHEYVYDNRGLLKTTYWDNVAGGYNTSESRTYDAFGRLRTVTDARNVTSNKYEYDRLGREIATVDGLNGSRVTTYDAFSRTLTMRDALGNTTTYSYDDATRTSTLTIPNPPANIVVTTVHTRHGQTLSVTAAGNTTTYEYDANGNLLSGTDSGGVLETRTYDRGGRLITQSDALGTITSFEYDAANRVFTRTVDSDGLALQTIYTHDGQGRVTDVHEYNGRHTHTTYDRAGRVSEVAIDPNGMNLRTHYTYDRQDHVVSVTEGFGSDNPRRTKYVYDTLGRRTEEIVDAIELGGTLNLRTVYSYDANDNVTRKIDANGHSTWYVYDDGNQLIYTVDALGSVIRNWYDPEGRVKQTRRYATSLTASTLENIDAPTEAQVARPNSPLDSVSRSFFDPAGRERYTIDTLGTVTERTFDDRGNVTRERVIAGIQLTGSYADAEAVSSALGAAATTVGSNDRIDWMAYDPRGRLEFKVDGLGAVTRYSYDAEGNVTSKSEFATLRSTALASDLGTLRLWADANASNASNRTTRFWYDTLDRLRFTLDAEGYLTETRYSDATREQTSTVYAAKPAGLTATSTLADVVTIAQGLGNVTIDQTTRTVFDVAGRAIRVIDSLGRTEHFGYDAVGNRTSYTSKNGSSAGDAAYTWNYYYDGAGRRTYEYTPPLQITSSSGTVSNARVVTKFEYDAMGNLRFRHEAYGTPGVRTTEYQYDLVGRRSKEIVDPGSGHLNITTEYKYDAKGNLTRKIATHSTWYVYDAANRLTHTVDALGGVTQYQYDTFGDVTSTRRFATVLAGDTMNTLAGVDVASAASVALPTSASDRTTRSFFDRVGQERYTIDALGTVTERTFDAYGQIIRERILATATLTGSYADLAAVTAALGNAATALDSRDRVHWTVYDLRGNTAFAIDGLGGVTRYIYDANGNLASKTEFATARDTTEPTDLASLNRWATGHVNDSGDRTTRYWYDSTNRLRFTLDAQGYLTEQRYDDAAHQEFSIVYAGKPTIGSDATLEQVRVAASSAPEQADNQTTRRILDAAGRVVQVENALTRSEYFGYDALGNKTSYTNQKGAYAGDPAYTWNYEYDAAGRMIYERSPAVDYTVVREENGVMVVDPAANQRLVTRLEYDTLGNLRFRHEAYGTGSARVTEYRYDALGRQTSVWYPRVGVYNATAGDSLLGYGSTAVTRTDSDQNLLYTEVAYDALGNAYSNRDVAGQYTFKVYDRLGRVTYEVDAENHVTSYEYDAYGNQTLLTRYADDWTPTPDAPRTAADITTRLTPNAAADRVIVTTYDRLNRIESVTQTSVSNYLPSATPGASGTTFNAGATTRTQYNAFGDVVLSRQQLTNAPTYADTYYYYDRLGQKVAEVDPAGYLTRYVYDETGDLERKIEYARPRTGTLDTTTYGTIVTTTRHDAPNNAAGYDRETSYGYDQLNRKISETKVDVEYSTLSGTTVANNFGDQVTRFDYDALGNVTVVTDQNLAKTYTYYDALGRVIAIAEPARDPGNGSTLIPYARMFRDAHGNLVQQINYGGGATSIPSNGALPTAATPPVGTPNRVTTLLLDSHGRAIRTRDASGAERFASYDARGKLAKEWQVATNAGDPNTTADDTSETLVTIYRYDRVGRQLEVLEPQRHTSNGTVNVHSTVKYNAFGEVTEKGIDDPATTQTERQEFFDYDQAGRVWRTNSGDGVVKVYLYNMAGQVTAELRSQSVDLGLATYTSAQDVVARVSAANLMRTETLYDARGKVVEQRLPSFGTSNGPEQVTTNVQISAESVGGPMVQGLTASIVDSADWYTGQGSPNGGQWINSNRVSLSWPSVGNGEVFIVIYYKSYTSSGGVGSNKIYSQRVSGAATGTSLSWQDNSTSTNGGISAITDVYVYGADGALLRELNVTSVPPTPLFLHWTGEMGQFAVKFEYRVKDSGSAFRTLGVTDLAGDQIGVAIGGLPPETYEYRISYARQGDASPYAESTGTFTMGLTAGPPSDPAHQPGALNVTNVGGYIRWTAPTDSAITAVMRYRLANSSAWVNPPLTANRVGGSFEVDARNALSVQGSYLFEIEYTKGAQIVAVTSGSVDSTGTVVTRTTQLGLGGTDPHQVYNELIGTPSGTFASTVGAVMVSSEHPVYDNFNGYGYLRWADRNVVELNWANLGSRAVTVKVHYITSSWDSWTGPSDTNGGYWAPNNPIETVRYFNVANAGSGARVDWGTSDQAGGGGITRITRVEVIDQATNAVLLNQPDPLGSYGDRVFWWPAPTSLPEGPIKAYFGYKQGTANYTDIEADLGNVYSVRADNLPLGVSQYRIQYRIGDRVIAEQIGTLNIQLASSANSTVTSVQTDPPPGATANVATVVPSGGLGPVSGTVGGTAYVVAVANDPWGNSYHWVYQGENVVNVSFANFNRATRVWVDYTTRYNSEPPVPEANKSASQDFAAGAAGGQVRWINDQYASEYYDTNTEWFAGGLSTVNRVRVYGQDANGNYTELLADSAAPTGTPRLNWSAPSDTSLTPKFWYLHPTQGWTERSITPGSTLSVDLSGIPPGSYQYKIAYYKPGESTERCSALGTFTTNGFAASSVTQTNFNNDPSWWSLTATGSTVRWQRQPTAGTTIEFQYYRDGQWRTLTPQSVDGVNYSVDFSGVPSSSYQYRLTYRVGTAAPYLTSTGTVGVSIQTTPIPAKLEIAPVSNVLMPAAQITPVNRSGDRLSWSYAKQNAADRIEVRYWLYDAPGTVYTATVSGSSPNWYADLLSVPANVGRQLVSWEIDYYRYRSDLGRYETSSYARTSGYQDMTPVVTVTQPTLTIQNPSTVYYHATATATVDTPVLATDPETRHADALNTTVSIGTVIATSTPDFGYTITSYQQDENGGEHTTIEWAPNIGGYDRNGVAGNYVAHSGRYIYWSDPPEVVGEIAPVFVYRQVGSATWTTVAVEKVFSGNTRYLGANIGSLGAGTYEYQIRYFREGDVTAFAVRTGEVTNPATATAVVDTTTSHIRSADVLAPRMFQQTDRWGNVISTTDALAKTTYYRYNQFDQMTERRLPEVEIVAVAANGAVTRTPNGTPISHQYYDRLGRLIATRDENGNVNAFTLNAAGQAIVETHADNTSRSTTFDVFGNKLVEVDERHFRTEHTYDTRNLLTQTIQDAGALPNWQAADLITTSFAYDEAGRRIAQTDGNTLTTRTWYDLLGNVTKTVTPMGRTTSYEYDLYGNITRETNAINDVKTWKYDYFGRLQHHDELGNTITAAVQHDYFYNFAGLLKLSTNSVGSHLEQTYDAAGHLVMSHESGWTNTNALQGVRRLTTYEYDIMGRQIHVTMLVNQRLEQEARIAYDAAGRLSSMWDRSGGTHISYDAAGNRTRIQSSALATNNVALFSRSVDSYSTLTLNQISKDWYSQQNAWDVENTDFWYAYDNMNRMRTSRGTNSSGLTVTGGVTFTYDAVGNKQTRTQTDYVYTLGANGVFTRTAQPNATSTDVYKYDGAKRLTDVIRDGNTVEHYEYDQGSRQTFASAGSLEAAAGTGGGYYLVTRGQTYYYNEDNQLTSSVTTRRSTEPGKGLLVLESSVSYGVDAAGVMRSYDVNVWNATGTQRAYTLSYSQAYRLGDSYLATILTMERTFGSGGPENNVTTRTYAQDGSLYSFTDQKASEKNRHYVVNAEGQIIASRQDAPTQPDESRNFFVNGQNVGTLTLRRAPQTWDADRIAGFAFNVDDGVVSGASSQLPSTIAAQSGETLRSVAQRLWGDANLWYLLAQENGLSDPDAELTEGTPLRVPNEVVSIRNSAGVFRPYDANAAIGNTSPEQIIPYVPPPKGKKGCGVIGQILLIIVAVVVTYITAGATSTYFAGLFGSLGGAIATGAVAAAAGSIVSQGVAIATGMQEDFNWKDLASAAIGGAIGGAFTNGIGIKGIPGEIAQGALNSALNQGVSIALGLQDEFNWNAVASAAVAAPIANRLGKAASKSAGKLGDASAEFASTLTRGLVNQASYAVFTGGKINYVQLAADAFGNALGNSLAPKQTVPGLDETRARNEAELLGTAMPELNFADEVSPVERVSSPPLDNNPGSPDHRPMPTAEYSVQRGDNLSRIAERELGDADLWPAIAALNDLSDPNRIAAGQKLTLPNRLSIDADSARNAAGEFYRADAAARQDIKKFWDAGVSQVANSDLDDLFEFSFDRALLNEASRPEARSVLRSGASWYDQYAAMAGMPNLRTAGEALMELPQNPTFIRTIGALQAIGGAGEMAAGTMLSAFPPLAAAVIAHGADVTQAGINQLRTGEYWDDYTVKGLQAFGFSPGVAHGVDMTLSLAGSVGAPFASSAGILDDIAMAGRIPLRSVDDFASLELDVAGVAARREIVAKETAALRNMSTAKSPWADLRQAYQQAKGQIDFGHIEADVTIASSGRVTAKGGHFSTSPMVDIVQGTESVAPNGVLESQVRLRGPDGQFYLKTNNGGYSTLTPESWSLARAKGEMSQAWLGRTLDRGTVYKGTSSGVDFRFFEPRLPNAPLWRGYPIYQP